MSVYSVWFYSQDQFVNLIKLFRSNWQTSACHSFGLLSNSTVNLHFNCVFFYLDRLRKFLFYFRIYLLVFLELCNRGESRMRVFFDSSFIPQIFQCPFLYLIFINNCIFVPLFRLLVFTECWDRVFLAWTMPRLSSSLKPFSQNYKLWRCLLPHVDDFTFLEVERVVYIALEQNTPYCL